MAEAYQFKAKDYLITNDDLYRVKEFLEQNPSRFPLASCGYNAAPWRIEYLLPQSHNFVDCFNVLEDSLAIETPKNAQWKSAPNLTLVIDTLTFMGVAKAYPYILEPMAEICSQHVRFQKGVFIVCDVPFDEYKSKLEPNTTVQELIKTQHWYQTRIKSN